MVYFRKSTHCWRVYFAIAIFANSSSSKEFFDLGYELDEANLFYPGQRFDYELYRDIEGFNTTSPPDQFQYWFAMFSFCMGEHGGTHVDAPFHFNENGWKLGEIPPNRLIDIPTAVIDVEPYVFALKNPQEFKLEVEHLVAHERQHGRIPLGGIVLVHFGWGRYWPDKQRYFGMQENGTVSFPGLSGNASKWLVEQRRIVGVGVDSASADVGNFGKAPISHLILCGSQVYIIENVANLTHLLKRIRPRPARYLQRQCDLRLVVMPLKSKGTGGPARVFAYCNSGF